MLTFSSPFMTIVVDLLISILVSYIANNIDHARIKRGGGGRESGPHLKNHKNIGFLSNTGPDPLKITKIPSQNL